MNNVNLFGSSYSPVGSSTSDLLLKSRGKVKIQVGNKFIDLIKDGKINVQSKFIYQQNEVGKLDGIYVVGEDIFLVVDGNQINLNGGQETTYVSFMQPQKVTSEQKQQALINIGFVYPNLSSLEADNILNSIVYVQETQKLYIVTNGAIQEYSIPFPNPFTKQFIIEKNDDDKGAIYIKGTGEENGLRFDFMTIYSDGDYITFNCDTSVLYRVFGNNVLEITSGGIKSNVVIYCDSFQSTNAGLNSGFKLYTSSSGSTLEVDNLIVRNSTSSSGGESIEGNNTIYPTYSFGGINAVIGTQLSSLSTTLDKIVITLQYKNEYKVDDILYIYTYENNKMILNEITIMEVDDQKCAFKFTANKISSLNGSLVFLKKGIIIDTKELQYRPDDTLNTKIGSLEGYQVKDEGAPYDLSGYGMYSKQGVFSYGTYTKDYSLSRIDNSSRFASTEWIHWLLPKGTILMYNDINSIPKGWAICDGKNGTPNLTGKFIHIGELSNNAFTYKPIIYIMKIV